MIFTRLHSVERDLELLEGSPPRIAESAVDFKGVVVPKPWGEEYLLFENGDAAVWILHIKPQGSTSLHAHVGKTTSLIVLGGRAECDTFAGGVRMERLDAVVLGRRVFHKTANAGTEPLFLMEIESPVDKFDLVRHKDAYGRAGTAYESRERFVDSPASYLREGTREIGGVQVHIAFAETMRQFLDETAHVHDAVVTILDRHVWSSEGEKLIEVGSSFLRESVTRDFRINDRFHYVIIHKNEG